MLAELSDKSNLLSIPSFYEQLLLFCSIIGYLLINCRLQFIFERLLMAKGKLNIQKQQDQNTNKELNKDNSSQQAEDNHQIQTHTSKKEKKKKIKKDRQKDGTQNHKVQSLLETILRIQSRQKNNHEQQKKQIINENQNTKKNESIDYHNLQQQIQSPKKVLKHLAICFPDSIIQLPQTSTLRAYFISEIARICSIFKVDQIVILKDQSYQSKSEKFNPSQYLARNLQYLETPQYLRKYLFKMHPDLQNVGLMNPIEAQHHLKTEDVCEFRQGVSLERPTKKGKGSWIDIGLRQQAQIDVAVLPQTRMTVRLKNYEQKNPIHFQAQPVSKKVPKSQRGLYWGYDVRIAQNLEQIFVRDDQQNIYDIKICCHGSTQKLKQFNQKIKPISQFSKAKLNNKSLMLFYPGTQMDLKLIRLEEFKYSFDFHNIGVKQLRMEQQMFMSLNKLRQQCI